MPAQGHPHEQALLKSNSRPAAHVQSNLWIIFKLGFSLFFFFGIVRVLYILWAQVMY